MILIFILREQIKICIHHGLMAEVLISLRKIAAMNSLNLSFGQESKSSYSDESFLLLNNMFENNRKKNCQTTEKEDL